MAAPGRHPHVPVTRCRVRLARGQVADQLIELGVGLRRETACDALVELVIVEAAGEMLAAQDVRDRFPLCVADPKLPVSRAAEAAVIAFVRHDSSVKLIS